MKPRLLADIIGIIDCVPYDRKALYNALTSRLSTGQWLNKTKSKSSSTPLTGSEKNAAVDELFERILHGRHARLRGERPKVMGQFHRIAPSGMYEKLVKMKRVGFGEEKTLGSTQKLQNPIIV